MSNAGGGLRSAAVAAMLGGVYRALKSAVISAAVGTPAEADAPAPSSQASRCDRCPKERANTSLATKSVIP